MQLSFYSTAPNNTGAALFVSFNSKDYTLFFRLVKQTGYDAQIKKGTYKGGQQYSVAFNVNEVGEMINALRHCGEWSFYHSTKDRVVKGSLKYYKAEQSKKEGVGLSVLVGEDVMKVGFTLGTAETLAQYLEFALTHIFSAMYADEKKEAEQRKQSKAKEQESKPEQETQTEDAATTPEDDFEF